MTYREFFQKTVGSEPYPYQIRLSEGRWPDLLDIPTGLGKTAAVVSAWLFRSIARDPETPRRLVYCLPMRVLVEQVRDEATKWTAAAAEDFRAAGMEPPTVHVLMGGESDASFDIHPDRHAIVVGTQDMLLSRALNRGYGMSRYRWPVHFGLLNNDCLWIVDEIQLMGAGLFTTAQLQAFRGAFGAFGGTKTVWMSATAEPSWLSTVDHPFPGKAGETLSLSTEDKKSNTVRRRVEARKAISAARNTADATKALAKEILSAHVPGSRTLVIVNTVRRAKALHKEIRKANRKVPAVLVHSRFRPGNRQAAVSRMLMEPGAEGTIVVSTQVVEAGVDVSARTLFTELAPWSSLVQRFGRCNRAGEFEDARILWIDLPEKAGAPYGEEEIEKSRTTLSGLSDASPGALPRVMMTVPEGQILRRSDILGLCDTSQDLSGHDTDISRFIREGDDFDVHVFWRTLKVHEEPDADTPGPAPEELCPVPAGDMAKILKSKKGLQAWLWDPLRERWERASEHQIRPGRAVLLAGACGMYTPEQGWDPESRLPVEPVGGGEAKDSFGYSVSEGEWADIASHTDRVCGRMGALCDGLPEVLGHRGDLLDAARWHDAGKALPPFEALLLPEARAGFAGKSVAKAPRGAWRKGPAPKGNGAGEPDGRRPKFRHELASALLALAHGKSDLAAYLAAAHHGKIRGTIRSVPGEKSAPDGRRFARGVWEGDVAPETDLGGGTTMQKTAISLEAMEIGAGGWTDRALFLRETIGLFKLAYLEALVKAADEQASAEAP